MSSLKNIAIIMDGNGRWAQSRNRPRVWGHTRGAKTVIQIVEKAVDLKLKSLTLYAFSTENFSRPGSEVKILFKLLDKFLKGEYQTIISNNIQFDIIGDFSFLDEKVKNSILKLKNESSKNTGLKLIFAFGYGGKKEIINACNKIKENHPSEMITEETFDRYLYRPDISEIDLLIRTGGDFRISNFLLWQIAYAELYFETCLWPDFKPEDLERIISQVSLRDRRFGKINPMANSQAQKEQELLI